MSIFVKQLIENYNPFTIMNINALKLRLFGSFATLPRKGIFFRLAEIFYIRAPAIAAHLVVGCGNARKIVAAVHPPAVEHAYLYRPFGAAERTLYAAHAVPAEHRFSVCHGDVFLRAAARALAAPRAGVGDLETFAYHVHCGVFDAEYEGNKPVERTLFQFFLPCLRASRAIQKVCAAVPPATCAPPCRRNGGRSCYTA